MKMLTFLYEVHFWSLSHEISISSNDYGLFSYHDKEESIKSVIYEKKKLFAQQRGYKWSMSNKKPWKLKNNILELEETLRNHRIIRMKWLNENLIMLFISNGIVFYITVNSYSGDIINIYYDKILKEKLSSLYISDILSTNMFSICCYNDSSMTLVHYVKPAFTKPHKRLSDLGPRFISIQLPGPNGRRLPRKLSINKNFDIISVWWTYSNDDVYPWSPIVKDHDRANVHVYAINGSKIDLMCYHRTEHEILDMVFSNNNSIEAYLVEEYCCNEGIFIEVGCFDIIKSSKFLKNRCISVPVPSRVCCSEFSPDRNNLLLGCNNGTIILYNQIKLLTHIVKAAYVPKIIKWHWSGYIVSVVSSRGQIQCFDFALGLIKTQCTNELIVPSNIIDLSSFLTQPSNIQPVTISNVEWNQKDVKIEGNNSDDAFLLVSFSGGPLVILRIFSGATISPEFIVKQYMNGEFVDKAINILLAMDWDSNPITCCSLLKIICNLILNSSKATHDEKFMQMRRALGSFWTPVRPINQSVLAEFYRPVRNITRRLFHYLLRYNLNDYAANVALQLNEHDLFMDLYHSAMYSNNSVLATTALANADQILCHKHTTVDGSESDCSCSDSSSHKSFDERSEIINQRNINKLELQHSMNSRKTSFATISRVKDTRPITSTSTMINSDICSDVNFVTTNSKRYKNPYCKVSIEKLNLNSRSSPTSIDETTFQLNLTSHTIDPNDKPKSLTGSEDGKIITNKSIKVVHFGVV